MPENIAKSSLKRPSKIRQILTGLGILSVTFGAFVWQWQTFSQRNNTEEPANITEEVPPPRTHWHEATTETRLAIGAAIRGQLKSFQHTAVSDGLRFHTRAVRQNFGTSEEYTSTVRREYPIIANNQRSKFRFINTDKTHHFANAGLTIWNTEGRAMETVYQLVFQDKEWRISGIAKHVPKMPQ